MSEQSSSEIVDLSQEANEQLFPTRGYAATDYGYTVYEFNYQWPDRNLVWYDFRNYSGGKMEGQGFTWMSFEEANRIITPGEVPPDVIEETEITFPRVGYYVGPHSSKRYTFLQKKPYLSALYRLVETDNATGDVIYAGKVLFFHNNLRQHFNTDEP